MFPSDKDVSGNWICGKPYRDIIQLRTWKWDSKIQCWQSIDHMGRISFNYSAEEMARAGWEIIEKEKYGCYTYDVTSIWGARKIWNDKTKMMTMKVK